jgi:N-glycosidase YbiA
LELKEQNAKILAALESLTSQREGSLKSEAVAESKAEAKKSGGGAAKKPKGSWVKLTCPPAADGVVRFYSSGADKAHKEFSNLYKSPFELDGKEFLSVEHYFQYKKFDVTDPEYAEKIRVQTNPILVKGMGKTRTHPLVGGWDNSRIDIMRAAMFAKFRTHAPLREKLLATGDARLEEESPYDAFWGIGSEGSGVNMSGKLLMEVRAALLSEERSLQLQSVDSPPVNQ